MKKETRNLIVENIGLAWVYASPKARQYLNVALQGFAQHEREQDAAIDKLAAYVMEEADQLTSQPRKGSKKGAILASLKKRAYGVSPYAVKRAGQRLLACRSICRIYGQMVTILSASGRGKKNPVYKLVG